MIYIVYTLIHYSSVSCEKTNISKLVSKAKKTLLNPHENGINCIVVVDFFSIVLVGHIAKSKEMA